MNRKQNTYKPLSKKKLESLHALVLKNHGNFPKGTPEWAYKQACGAVGSLSKLFDHGYDPWVLAGSSPLLTSYKFVALSYRDSIGRYILNNKKTKKHKRS